MFAALIDVAGNPIEAELVEQGFSEEIPSTQSPRSRKKRQEIPDLKPPSTKMPEYGWSTQVESLSAQPWIELKPFLKVLTHLEGINYTVKAQRDDALAMLNSAHCDAPFSKVTRFPADKIYISLMTAPQMNLWADVKQALGFSDRFAEVSNTKDGEEVTGRKWRSQQDSKKSFIEKVKSLKSLVSGREWVEQMTNKGVFNQATFEATYNLVWKP